MNPSSVSIGIDVSKHKLDIHHQGNHLVIDNRYDSVVSWLKKLDKQSTSRIVCEASGGYERVLLRACQETSIPLCVINAKRVRDFAKGAGFLAKTDKVDAAVLARYGELLEPEPKQPIADEHLRSLVQRRSQLVELLKVEKQCLEHSSDDMVLEDIKDNIKQLQKRIMKIEQAIDDFIKQSEEYEKQLKLITSCNGVGWITAITLLTECPEIGKISHPKLAALVGVAPFNHESGQYKGKASIRGGRSAVRKVLYMATISAIRCNADIKDCYQRLKSAGKPSKVAIIACLRKLLIQLSAVIKRGTPWVSQKSSS